MSGVRWLSLIKQIGHSNSMQDKVASDQDETSQDLIQGSYKWILTDFSKFLTTFWPLLEEISPFFLTNWEGKSYHVSQIAASGA